MGCGWACHVGEGHRQILETAKSMVGPEPLGSMYRPCPELLIQGRTRALYFEVTKFLLMTLKCFLTTFYKFTSSSSSHNSTCNLIKRQ